MSGANILAKHLYRHEIVFTTEVILADTSRPRVRYAYMAGRQWTEERMEELEAQLWQLAASTKSSRVVRSVDRIAMFAKGAERRLRLKFRNLNIVDHVCIALDNPERSVVVCGASSPISPQFRRQVSCLVHMFEAGRRMRRDRPLRYSLRPLSEKQVKVVRMASTGMSYANIARQMGISEVTVRFHLSKARERFGLASNIQLLVAFNQHFI